MLLVSGSSIRAEICRSQSSAGVVHETGLGGSPAIGLSRDGTYFAAWHDQIGLELWNTRNRRVRRHIDGRVTPPFAALVSNADPADADDSFNHEVAFASAPAAMP